MYQIILSIQRLVHEFLIPLIGSLLIHALVFFILANYISGYTNKQQAQSKLTLTVTLKPKIYKDLASSDNQVSKKLEPPLSSTENNYHENKSTNAAVADSNEQLFELPISPYYTIKELDQVPSILKNVDSDPPELLQFPQGGELTIRIWIDDKGSVIKTEIVKSELPEEFNKSALKRFLEAKFTPGIKNNIPVKTVAKITIKYAPKSVD